MGFCEEHTDSLAEILGARGYDDLKEVRFVRQF